MNSTTPQITQVLDLNSIFATGGVSALLITALVLILRFLQQRHHLVSTCTAASVSITSDTNTPRKLPNPVVDVQQHRPLGPIGRTSGPDESSVSGTADESKERETCSSHPDGSSVQAAPADREGQDETKSPGRRSSVSETAHPSTESVS